MTTQAAATTRWTIVFVVCLGVALTALDMTIVAVALPAIGAEFAAPPATTQWVLLGYSLPLVALSLPAGRWIDRAGPRPAFRLAVAGFGVTSAVVAAAPTIEALVAGRVLQGAAGALISVLAVPIISEAVRPEHRARAMSILLTLIPLSGVAGPALGGVLTDAFGWRSVFLINLPIAALVIALAGAVPARHRGRAGLPRPNRAELLDAAVLGVGVAALVLALALLGADPSGTGPVGIVAAPFLLLVAAGAATLWARRPDTARIRALLRTPRIAPSLAALLVTTAGAGAATFVVPYVLAEAGTSASATGAVLLSLSAAMAVTSPPAGVLADRVGTGPVVGGTVAILGGAVWLLAVPGSPLGLAGPLLLMGVGHGLFAGPNTARVLDVTPAEQVGASSGLMSLVRTLGFTVGPALAALAWTITGGGPDGLRTAALLLVALGIVGVLAALASTHPRVGR